MPPLRFPPRRPARSTLVLLATVALPIAAAVALAAAPLATTTRDANAATIATSSRLPQPPAAQPDSAAASRQRIADSVIAALGDRASMPADSVFRDVQLLKGMPAAQLVRVMSMGYGRALGVSCAYCHGDAGFAESTREKRIAREMVRMSAAINADYVRKIPELRPNAVVNCTTCHRGSPRPVGAAPAR